VHITHWPGLFAVLLAIISFYGMTYVVIALNTGWRFGYWISAATFGALMFMLSIFWIANPVGPRGEEARWVPIAAAPDRISQASFGGKSMSTASEYPDTPWKAAAAGDTAQGDALSSSITSCITTTPEKLEEDQKKPCTEAQSLMPPKDEIPVIEGSPVVIQPEATDIRFATDAGALLGQVTVVPTTHDPRVAKNPIEGRPMGDAFRLLAIYNKGSLRVPPFASLFLWGIFFAFHLWGLSRAERRKLSPIAA
jgi:hypothetical protein